MAGAINCPSICPMLVGQSKNISGFHINLVIVRLLFLQTAKVNYAFTSPEFLVQESINGAPSTACNALGCPSERAERGLRRACEPVLLASDSPYKRQRIFQTARGVLGMRVVSLRESTHRVLSNEVCSTDGENET